MRKIVAAFTFVATIAFSTLAMATTWTDSSLDNFTFDSTHTSYTHTYDITDGVNGFVPGSDLALFGTLFLDFSGFGLTDKATIKMGNLIPDYMGWWNSSDQNIPLIWALWRLNDNGTLDLTVTRDSGTFTLVDSTLTVNGIDCSTPVPEPGTMLLLGIGLFGAAIYRKRRCTA